MDIATCLRYWSRCRSGRGSRVDLEVRRSRGCDEGCGETLQRLSRAGYIYFIFKSARWFTNYAQLLDAFCSSHWADIEILDACELSDLPKAVRNKGGMSLNTPRTVRGRLLVTVGLAEAVHGG